MDAVDYLHGRKLKPRTNRRTARGFVKSGANTVRDVWRYQLHSSYWNDYNRESSREWVVKAGILYEVSNPVDDISFDLGLRPKDIPETLWAVTPYSFMVDRVINVSDIVRGVTNLLDPNVKILAGWTVLKDTHTQSWEYFHETNGSYQVTIVPDTSTWTTFKYEWVPWYPTALDIIPPSDIGGLVKDATTTTDLLSLIYARFSDFGGRKIHRI